MNKENIDKDVEEFWRQLMDKIDLVEWLRRIEYEHRFDNIFTRIEPKPENFPGRKDASVQVD